jgi:hypothetical protein
MFPRWAAICGEVRRVIDGDDQPEDLLSWIAQLQRTDAAILDDEGCRSVVGELRTILELRVCGAIDGDKCVSDLARVVSSVERGARSR